MAKKITDPAKENAKLSARTDEQILAPNIKVTIQGELLTVKELTFNDHIEYSHLISPLKKAFDQLALNHDSELLDHAMDIFFNNGTEASELLALCCDKSAEWVRSLPISDFDLLIDSWWSANGSFFINRLTRKGMLKELIAASQALQQAGLKFSQP
ncbi:hypothetical protein MTZ49_01500 [Entomomonas sp. E2T0]|uniref:DUF6631 family protein n=1 Tax=Entomomonas sp. E2T0 TaxID=2930213 RepID=UPI0022282B9B|nr:DUF6631 family protein [Entomomonas sp. E2T0]UYZ84283.1 hypothetical protein MTZ49_01500 [Entomomonas sp. E2T0]